MPIKIEIIGENGAEIAALIADLKKHLAACDASPAAVAAVTNATVTVEAPPGKADPEYQGEPAEEEEEAALPQTEAPKKGRGKKAGSAPDAETDEPTEASSGGKTSDAASPAEPSTSRTSADLDKLKADTISLAVQIFARTKQGGPARIKELQAKYNVTKFADIKPEQVEAFAADVAEADEATKG